MSQIVNDDQGVEWSCEYEPPAFGTRGLILFVSPTGERRCRRTYETFGLLVHEGKAADDALRRALTEARLCPDA